MRVQQYYTSFEIKNNDKGLYEAYFQIYYPEDYSAEALAWMKKQTEELGKQQSQESISIKVSDNNRVRYPRLKHL